MRLERSPARTSAAVVAIRRSGRERRVANAKPRMIAASSVAVPANRNVRATPLCARVTPSVGSPTPIEATRRPSRSTGITYRRTPAPLIVTSVKPSGAVRTARTSGLSRCGPAASLGTVPASAGFSSGWLVTMPPPATRTTYRRGATLNVTWSSM